jgi:DNA adenine methylase
MHEATCHEAAERWRARGHSPAPELPDLERAFDFFVCSWMGRNGVAGTQSYNQGFCVRYTKNGGHAATRFQSVRESIPAWHARLRNMTILNRDGLELLERVEDAAGVAIYCDPPYLVKGAKYVHDFADGFMGAKNDHERLASLLSRFRKTRVVVSYYDHPALASLYPGWTVRRCPTVKALVNQGMRDRGGAVEAPEVLLINGPSLAGGAA